MLIAIDHGNKQIKTVHHKPFTAGLVESDIRPFGEEVLEYNGKFYSLTDQRIPYRRDKTDDDRYFVLTLFAIAYELEAKDWYSTGTLHVELAVGLPPAHFGTQETAFTRYFSGRGEVRFSLHARAYTILIDDVACFPQSYAAAVTIFRELATAPKALILDIGGYTADYLQIRQGQGDLSVCDSLERGVIFLYNRIRSKARTELDILLEESEIDAILQGRDSGASKEVAVIVEQQAREYINDLLNTLRELQLELKSGKVAFVGGGALLLRKQIEASGKVPSPLFVEDISANAKGYELMYRATRQRKVG